jgi:Phosphotransferase enzyme family
MPEREAKPRWSAVPDALKLQVNDVLGARVVRARRAFGGYGPSATFVLNLDDGRRIFFKGVYPLSEGSAVRWSLDVEERVYQELGHAIRPWAPQYLGSVRADGWHALLLESVTGRRFPPWAQRTAALAARSYAAFHASTIGGTLPDWLPRDQHLEFVGFWQGIAADREAFERLIGAAGHRRADAQAWLSENLDALAAAEPPLADVGRPFALLHFDTRSDNIRLDGDLLRMFDWPFACVGPVEFDLAAFAQSIESEGGPAAEHVVGWYEEVLTVREDVLSASVAAIAGYFGERAPLADPPGLPRLRSVQRRQLKASLAWAARELRLPPPHWLAAVPD